MSRRPSRARIARAILAEAPGASLLVVLLAALLGGGAAAASAWASHARSEVLRSAVAEAPAAQRDLGDTARGVPTTGQGAGDHGLSPDVAAAWGVTFDSLDAIAAAAEPPAAVVLGEPHAVLQLDQASARPTDPAVASPDTSILLRADPLLDHLVEVVDGVLPGPIVDGEPMPIVLTPEIADAFGWPLGQVRSAHYSVGDRELQLVGLVRARDAAADEWDHAGLALTPGVIDNFNAPPTFVGVGYVDAASIGQWESLAPAATLAVWLPVHPQSLEADEADATLAALRRLASTPHAVPIETDWGAVSADIALVGTTPSIITSARPLIAGISALHTAVASGASLAGGAVLALAVRALVARRRGLLRLVAARGASERARAGALALGAGVLALLGAAPAAAIVMAMVGGPPEIIVAATSGLVLLAAAAAAVDGLLFERAGIRPDDTGRRRSRARDAVDGGVVLLAGAAAILVVLAPGGSREAPPPLAVLLPAFVAAAGCVIALRLAPLVVRAFEAAARRGRGLVALLGPARAGRDATTGVVPVLALVIAVTIAVLGAGLLATVQEGVDDATRSQLGADVRLDSPYLSAEQLAEVDGLAGIEALATVASDPDIEIEFPDGKGRVTVYVVDPAAFATASTSALVIPGAGALVSQTVASRLAGDPLVVGRDEVPIAGVAPDDGPFGRASAWIVTSPATAQQLAVEARPRALLVAAAPEDRAQLREALAAKFASAGTVRTVDEVLAQRRGAPAVRALVTGTTIAVAAAAVLTVLAAVLALTAGAAGRARVFGLLRALGARSRAEYPLVLWELLPALIVAVPLGIGCGLLVLPLLAGAGDLRVFTGGGTAPQLAWGLDTAVAVVAALIGVVVLGVLLAASLARRSGAARAVRFIDEEG
ncbi:MAG: FtsX-like permease family protein [Protaetiibacter sp.]